MHYTRFAAGLLLIAGCMLSCKKEKVDYKYDNRPDTTVGGNSSVRLVNLTANNQLIINEDTLTSYIILPQLAGGGEPNYPGTYWFKTDGRLGTTFTIPRQFMTNGKASVVTNLYAYQGMPDSVGFTVTEEYNKPKDYYIVHGKQYATNDPERVVEVPREITTPSKAGYFKIRLVNMADPVSPTWKAENVAVPLTLAYADGTVVSPVTSNIATHAWSEYVELPYGTYQFKVLTPAGTALISVGGSNFENTSLHDPATSTMTKPSSGGPVNAVSTGLTYVPLKTFQPGGVYTIAVGIAKLEQPYFTGLPGETTIFYQNATRIIADVSEPLNTDYFRMHAVQADPDATQVTFRVNGATLGEAAYATPTGYGIFVTGLTKVEAVDAAGNVIAVAEQRMEPGMNYTAWLYKQPGGKAAIVFVSNNLSGGYYNPDNGSSGQDGSLDMRRQTYPFDIRFLNLCADLPYVSFTLGNGQPTGSRNLQPGVPALDLPYTHFKQDAQPYQFMVYQSSPTVYPGTWLSEIPVLKSDALIARPEAYVRAPMPVHEPGVYTIALIGEMKGESKARMIIIKHTK